MSASQKTIKARQLQTVPLPPGVKHHRVRYKDQDWEVINYSTTDDKNTTDCVQLAKLANGQKTQMVETIKPDVSLRVYT